MKIFKYPLALKDIQMIALPRGAEVLCVQTQRDQPCLWAKVDPKEPIIKRCFVTYGTGEPADDISRSYVGTYQLDGGALVFHVFTDGVEYPEDS